ncbi:MAG: SDR family oxidoreductase [Bacilli bacterium]|nr:SDR family oxidoreductase [Bacilli bacterium]
MKTVLVTGSSRGIGKETIIEYAKNGYNVIINYNNSKKEAIELEKYVMNQYNVNVLTIKCDVSNEEEVIEMVAKSINKFKKIDVLVNNAGISIDNDISLKDSNEFKRVIDVNLLGSFLVTKYVSKHMLNEKEGNIIFVSSTNGIDTEYEYSIDYDASKAGVISLMHNFSKLLSPYIRVNTVAPGWVNTDYISNNLNDEFIQMEKDKVLLNRFANSIEIAKVIYFLSSDSASYINNTVIRVDGGLK